MFHGHTRADGDSTSGTRRKDRGLSFDPPIAVAALKPYTDVPHYMINTKINTANKSCANVKTSPSADSTCTHIKQPRVRR